MQRGRPLEPRQRAASVRSQTSGRVLSLRSVPNFLPSQPLRGRPPATARPEQRDLRPAAGRRARRRAASEQQADTSRGQPQGLSPGRAGWCLAGAGVLPLLPLRAPLSRPRGRVGSRASLYGLREGIRRLTSQLNLVHSHQTAALKSVCRGGEKFQNQNLTFPHEAELAPPSLNPLRRRWGSCS